jgi:hypothetical protein
MNVITVMEEQYKIPLWNELTTRWQERGNDVIACKQQTLYENGGVESRNGLFSLSKIYKGGAYPLVD